MPESRTAARVAGIAPFHVMDILARAQALETVGCDIIHLEIGEPDFATPAPIVEAGVAALRAGHTHYTGALGLPALREAIAQFYASRWEAVVDPTRIVITPGASGALLLALGLLAGPGDEVLMADPGYPCNRHFVRF
ncbi:MAG: aminotransferase class I/II-fold pyridoxal phosphate-dependent enzyme, partial [Thiobacillus sp.]